ncbi:hypothetical protein HPP92_019595 [Vanilla planifolia]|uniref:Uncharacterized protein n=1 Tax=Vanilla planifolia TaxID=51239 RepID=A0A835UN16_VANPL|nr:hypothetical protein HPP92_020020 [Vanilla planifolia]KAG0465431.1 hypothetical protein HPP92_019595 [Vanilla planifolia]
MKSTQDSPRGAEAQPPLQESQDNQLYNGGKEVNVAESNSISAANSDNRKVSREDIELVQNLIERCLQLYMNRGEVVRTLSSRARIEPGFTTLVWQKLEEENSEFFRAYYIRLKLKKQIIMFNHLLEHQCNLMKYPIQPKVPLAHIQNGVHAMPVNNLPMGYPIIQQAQMTGAGQPHFDSMGGGLSSCHVVNGIPATGTFQPLRINPGIDITHEAAPLAAPCSVVSTVTDMAVSPASVASSNHFPFTQSEMSGMGMDTAALDANFTADVAAAGGLPDGGIGSSRDSIRSLSQLWNFSLSDLTADLTNLGDLGPLGNYDGSAFLPSDSDILLDSPEPDDIVDEYFTDAINNGPCSQSDEDKS